MIRRCTFTWVDSRGVTHACGRAEHTDRRHQCGWPTTCTATHVGRTDGSQERKGSAAVSGGAEERPATAARPHTATTAAQAGRNRPGTA